MNTLFDFAKTIDRPLIVAHRGTPIGSAYPNTYASAIGAFNSGADIVELDVVRSKDYNYYAFHDGYERLTFDTDKGIAELLKDEISQLRYGKVLGGSGVCGVEEYFPLLSRIGTNFVNIDRSWRYWGNGFLEALSETGNHGYRILKSPPSEEYLDQLAATDVPFPYVAIVTTKQEVEQVRKRRDINLVGFEVLAHTPSDELANVDYLRSLKDHGLLIWLNALNLENLVPLFLGFDDDTSVFEDPNRGWGRLVEYGADIIQTDWPWLARRYFEQG